MIAVLKENSDGHSDHAFETVVREVINRRIRYETQDKYKEQMDLIEKIQKVIRSLELYKCEGMVSIHVQDGQAVFHGKMEVYYSMIFLLTNTQLQEARYFAELFVKKFPRSTFSISYQQTIIIKEVIRAQET